jgi:hypothetical protein
MEAETKAYLELKASAEVEVILLKNVSRESLLKPSDSKYRLLNQRFRLGDRILVTVDDSQIPFGSNGI